MLDANMTALLLLAALLACVAGMAWLALAMDVHWAQVQTRTGACPPLSVPGMWRLRVLGVLGLGSALMLCLAADHASMAALVWVMALAVAALLVALTLSWRPHWLRALAWVGAARG